MITATLVLALLCFALLSLSGTAWAITYTIVQDARRSAVEGRARVAESEARAAEIRARIAKPRP